MKLQPQQREALFAMAYWPGRTATELARLLNEWDPRRINRRLSELREKALCLRHERKLCPVTKRRAWTWTATAAGAALADQLPDAWVEIGEAATRVNTSDTRLRRLADSHGAPHRRGKRGREFQVNALRKWLDENKTYAEDDRRREAEEKTAVKEAADLPITLLGLYVQKMTGRNPNAESFDHLLKIARWWNYSNEAESAKALGTFGDQDRKRIVDLLAEAA